MHVVATGKDEAVFEEAERIGRELEACAAPTCSSTTGRGLARREVRDAELLGVPTIVIVGRGLAEGVVELWDRASGGNESAVAITEVADARLAASIRPSGTALQSPVRERGSGRSRRCGWRPPSGTVEIGATHHACK